MADKKPTSKKVFDITNPKKVVPSASSRPLIVTNRPIIEQDPMVSGASEPEQPSAPPLQSPAKKKTIKPLDDFDKSAVEPDESSTETTQKDAGEPAQPVEPEKAEPASDEAEAAAGDKPGTEETPPAEASEKPETADDDSEDDQGDDTSGPDKADDTKTPPATDAEEAKAQAEARARAAEIQKLVDSHQYFVPVNAVERKRSTRTSILLTIVIIILAIILIDLMLDSQIILLAEKIPHTHFFTGS